MMKNFKDEMLAYNDYKTFELHKKVTKQVKELEKPVDPRDMFGPKIKGVKNKSQYKKSMADLKSGTRKKTILL
jgi:hypothetical protein|tara:strand:+ start:132 stop:350 length:219 start_codon:yes stop_codon:yes gene_type:complete